MKFSDFALMGRAAQAGGTPPSGDLNVAVYKFATDGSDSSGNGLHLSPVSSPTIDPTKSHSSPASWFVDDSAGTWILVGVNDALGCNAVGQDGFTVTFWIYVPSGASPGGYMSGVNPVWACWMGNNGADGAIPYFQIGTVAGYKVLYPTSETPAPVDTWTFMACRCTFAHPDYGGNTVMEIKIGSGAWIVYDTGGYNPPTSGAGNLEFGSVGGSAAGSGYNIDDWAFHGTAVPDATVAGWAAGGEPPY